VRHYEIIVCQDEQQVTLDALAIHAGVHPALIERFVEFGLLQPTGRQDARLFDPSAIPRLRMICRLRETLGINLAGVSVVLDLLDRLCAVQRENQSLRSRIE
jgi:DNA-binding transcriptional MerR regulator